MLHLVECSVTQADCIHICRANYSEEEAREARTPDSKQQKTLIKQSKHLFAETILNEMAKAINFPNHSSRGIFLVTRSTWDLIQKSPRVDKQTHKEIINWNGQVGFIWNWAIHIGYAPMFGASWIEIPN